MSKLVIGLLSENDQLEKFYEIDMSWVDQFNSEFEKNEVPFKEEIYQEEFLDMSSLAMLNEFVYTEDENQFQVNREPLKEILRKLFGYERQEQK